MDSTLTAAEQLRDRLAAILEPVGAFATLNHAEVPSGSRHGVALLGPPELTFPTASEWNAQWKVHLVAGPSRDPIQAWATLDTLIAAVIDAGVPVTTADPATFPAPGDNLPAYTITIPG